MNRPETPWTDPQRGDRCSQPSGKTRTVRSVSYRGPFSSLPLRERPVGGWVDRVAFEAGGRLRTIAGIQWAAWCRTAVKAGGKYERAAVESAP